MATIPVTSVTAGTVIDAPHPVTGTRTSRTVSGIAVHPSEGVTLWYSDPFGPTRHRPGDMLTTVTVAIVPAGAGAGSGGGGGTTGTRLLEDGTGRFLEDGTSRNLDP